MIHLFESTTFMLGLVLGSFITGKLVYKKTRLAILHPIVISIAIIISFLSITKIDVETFRKGSDFINFLLGPVVVALGYVLYEKFELLKQNATSILTATIVGSVVGIFSVIFLCLLTGASQELTASLEPKSVTVPIAIEISKLSGGYIPLTIISVVIAGIFGSIVGPAFLRLIGIKSPMAVGLAIGSASHGIGTGRAMELGEVEGAFSGLAMGLVGVMTAIFIPIINAVIAYISA